MNAILPSPRRLGLNAWLLIGGALGVAGGFALTAAGTATPTGVAVLYTAKLASTFFLDLLRMVLVPLVFASIVCGVASLGAHHRVQRVWWWTLGFFVFSMLVSIAIGLAAANIFRPGEGMHLEMFADATRNFEARQMPFADYFAQFLHGIFQNPFAALAQGDILAVVVVALVFGIALAAGGERYAHLRRTMQELQELALVLVRWIMWLAPLGVGALLLRLVATQDVSLLGSLAYFIAVVIGATLLHGVVVLPAILFAVTGMTPLRFWRGARDAMVLAFGTSSSAATMPVALRCVSEDLGVRREVADFVIPLGATLNSDGTALYEGAAALFIARLAGIELDIAQQLIIVFVAILGAVGAPGIPSVGMLSMVLVLQSVGLPTEAIALLLPIDRILDTVRTAVNVEGDMVGSLIVEKMALGSSARDAA
ncbi:dicarboxylate/amino acid:cation symporter [Rhodocyclus gracilis]|uniref:dicarboxylate/amino acid:cation symporter n=1 Tax=Rhodocyclus gracilis TaxID=2929842 RepID=UPI0030FE6B70